ncbi:hypothetical protein B0H21DRAFT_775934 [Amylocystis lapponica]|nr:hypothetical protein B0H21DRAFT_775934 [Amylocystis lapponica]
MPRCPIKRVSLPKHHFHVSAPSHSALALSLPDLLPTTHRNDPRTQLLLTKYADLRSAMYWERPEPNRVWGCYIELLNLLGFEKLPLEIHQAVLRKCSPPTNTLRVAHSLRIARGARSGPVHLHEARFRGVIRNIRMSGWVPVMDDYHFILEQFAAVGHDVGSMSVFDEITQLGLKKTPRTYGLCLQALCHRLTLPCWHRVRPELVSSVTRSCVKILGEMGKQDVPFTSANVDLATWTGMSGLCGCVWCGPSYPDRPPLDHWDEPLPLSTAALNTTIDMLGMHGQVSKMVQTFEVLTTPLPSGSTGASSSFDDEDEDDFGVLNPRVAPYPPRYAAPNTSTYHMLIKWVSRAGHAVFARHYVVQAMRLDRDEAWRLRKDCMRLPRDKILAPHFGLNRSMLLPVFAEANRDKNMALMRWVLVKAQQVLRRKRADISVFKGIQAKWRDADADAARDALLVSDSSADMSLPDACKGASTATTSASSSVFSTFFSPSSSSSDQAIDKTVALPPTPYFDLDLDAPPSREPPPPKYFDIALHLSILQREVDMLANFERHVLDITGRTTQRVKERLGRRVWDGKDIYMSDKGRRVTVTRNEWQQKVQFRPERASPAPGVVFVYDEERKGRRREPHPAGSLAQVE